MNLRKRNSAEQKSIKETYINLATSLFFIIFTTDFEQQAPQEANATWLRPILNQEEYDNTNQAFATNGKGIHTGRTIQR